MQPDSFILYLVLAVCTGMHCGKGNLRRVNRWWIAMCLSSNYCLADAVHGPEGDCFLPGRLVILLGFGSGRGCRHVADRSRIG